MNLADGRFNLCIDRYVNNQRNSRPDNTMSALRTIPLNIEKRILQVAPAAPLQRMDFNRYANANCQVTNTSEPTGYDIELAASPTASWHGVLNVGGQHTVTQIDDTWWNWVEQRLPAWKTFWAGWDVEHITAASPLTIHNQHDQWVVTQRDPLVAKNSFVVAN